MTAILFAFFIVVNLCAIKITVLSLIKLSKANCTIASDSLSSADVASSSITIGAFFMIALAITNGDGKFVLISLFPLVFSIVATVLGIKYDLCASITVDQYLQTVVIKSKKMCCCYSGSNIIQISEIQQVIVQIDQTTSYQINRVNYNAFEIIFKLVNGREVRGCSGVINKNNEGARAASILRNGLPSNIPFGGELCY